MSAQVDALVAQCIAAGQTDQAIAAAQMRQRPGLTWEEIGKLAMRRTRSGWIDGVVAIAKMRLQNVETDISELQSRMRALGGFDSDFDKSDTWLQHNRPLGWSILRRCPELLAVRSRYMAAKELKKTLERTKCVQPKEADALIATCLSLERVDDALRASALGASEAGLSSLVMELVNTFERHDDALTVARRGVSRAAQNHLISTCIRAGKVDAARQAAQVRGLGLSGDELSELSGVLSRAAA